MEKDLDQDQGNAPRVGASAELPHDRTTVQRFREAFPRARWSDTSKAWFVPGRTAEKRIRRWFAKLEAEADAFADEKGRDAFEFDPIDSPYLEVGASGFRIRTPYSKTVVSELREVPFARWDEGRRYWAVPFRSYAELRRRWPVIETAARRNEPDMRKLHREALKGSAISEASKARARERRRRRYPVPTSDLPPLERAIGTHLGIVFFTGTDGELADSDTVATYYFSPRQGDDLVWAAWRPGLLQELVATWPARSPPGGEEIARGWWFPNLDELRVARREARARERMRQRRLLQRGLASTGDPTNE